VDARGRLAEGLLAASVQLYPAEAARLLDEALATEPGASAGKVLVPGLSAISVQLPPTNAARLLAEALAGARDADVRVSLAVGLSAASGRLPPAEAAAVCGPPARLLAHALAKETDAYARGRLAEGLSAVSVRLPPAEAVRLLTEALAKATDAGACKLLAEGLVIVTDRVEPAEADRICEPALALVQQREVSAIAWEARMALQEAASVLVQQLVEEKARGMALQLARQTAAAPAVNRHDDRRSELRQVVLLDRLLSDGTPPHRRRGAVATASAVGLAYGGPLPALAALPSAAEPLPCRLTTPELVELLKYPTCIGPARQVVLKHLGQRYGRTFANHWEFVRFANEHNLGLDFTGPPKRPRENAPAATP
jgi:hypothetical protein